MEFDAGLNAAVRRLRAALGDEAEKPRYIETVPRKGYRFNRDAATANYRGVCRSIGHSFQGIAGDGCGRNSLAHRLRNVRPFWRRAVGIYRRHWVLAVAMTLIALGVFGIRQWRELNAADGGAITASNEQLRRGDFFTQRRAPGDLRSGQGKTVRAGVEPRSVVSPGMGRAWQACTGSKSPRASSHSKSACRKIRAAAQKALDPRSATGRGASAHGPLPQGHGKRFSRSSTFCQGG